MKKSVKLTRQIDKLEKQLNLVFADHKNEGFDAIKADSRYDVIHEKQRTAKNQLNYWEKREINKYCNQHFHTDVEPYEVVKIISDKTVEVRAMTTKQIEFPKAFTPGGFVGHFADNRAGQDYDYISNPEAEIERVRWSEANQQWQQGKYSRFLMSDSPYKFYDYNF